MVRLEVHDAPPGPDRGFDDVVETPYHASSGGLALSTLTGGSPWQADFDLGDAARYRVRIARQADTWLLRFRPDPVLEPPKWLARSTPAVGAGSDGWHDELPHGLMEVAYLVGNLARDHGGWLTVEQLDQWWRTHRQAGTGLDEPLWPEPARRPTTGHADLDQRNADRHATALAHQAKERDRVDEITAELGTAPVRSRREALPLLAAAGILRHEEPDRYRAGRPAAVHAVLTLPAERVRRIQEADERNRFLSLAEDVTAVLRWAPAMPFQVSTESLAARLLVGEEDLRGAVAYADRAGLLHTLQEEPLRLVWGRRPEPAPTEPAEPAGSRTRSIDEAEAVAVLREEVETILSQIQQTLRSPEATEKRAWTGGPQTARFLLSTTYPKRKPKPEHPPYGPPVR